jgi:hypothetical protein
MQQMKKPGRLLTFKEGQKSPQILTDFIAIKNLVGSVKFKFTTWYFQDVLLPRLKRGIIAFKIGGGMWKNPDVELDDTQALNFSLKRVFYRDAPELAMEYENDLALRSRELFIQR